MHLIAKAATPLLNTPDFPSVFGKGANPFDHKGLIRSVEMIALPGTKFTVTKSCSESIAEVTTLEYPSSPLYLDTRFTNEVAPNHPERKKNLPPLKTVIAHLKSRLGLPYIWGGNWSAGVGSIVDLYGGEKNPERTLSGLDCSGLLYEATSGYTPRNTSELISFGEEISLPERPLDLIVWRGHILIALNQDTVIESLYGKGVIVSPLKQRMGEIQAAAILPSIRRFFIDG